MRFVKLGSVALIGVSLALAQNVAAQLKIAVVDAETAIGQTEEAKQFLEVVQQDLAADRETLETLQAEIQALQQRVANEGDVMSETERRGVAKDLEDKRLDLQFNAQKYENEVQSRQTEFLTTMSPKFRAVLDDLIKVERYDFVLPARGIVFGNARHDITAKITEKLNEKHAEVE